jgi:hypothetical protein
MKNKLTHPLWTHIPAIGTLVFIIIYTLVSGPLPSRAAIHFSFRGVPNSWASPYLVFAIVAGLSVLYIGISVLFDELWARQEKKKKFNWISLFDELSVGFLAGTYIGYIQYLKSGDLLFKFSWPIIAGVTVGLLVLASILDMLRPFRPAPQKVAFSDTAAREKDLADMIKRSESFVHWESQNPFWITLVTVVLPVILFGVAAWVWFSVPWASLVLIVTAAMMFFPYGGMQVAVTRRDITVRFGIIGSRVLRLKTDEIESVELAEFSPIADFGGYGIRRNKEIWAYYMRGSRGIKLTTTEGKKYIIGSDRPEELYAVAQAVVSVQQE